MNSEILFLIILSIKFINNLNALLPIMTLNNTYFKTIIKICHDSMENIAIVGELLDDTSVWH